MFDCTQDNSGSERTRRSRKAVNYAELNDVYLPPLGPSDFIATGSQPGSTESTERNVQSVSTRASRRRRDLGSDLEQYSVSRSDGRDDSHCRLPYTRNVVEPPSSSSGEGENQSGVIEKGICSVTDVDQSRGFSPEQSLSETFTNTDNGLQELPPLPHQRMDKDNHSLNTTVSEPVPIPDHKLPVWNGGSMTDSGKVVPDACEMNGIFKTPIDCLPLSEQ